MRRSRGGLHGAGAGFRLPEPVFAQQGCEQGHQAAHDGDASDCGGLAVSEEARVVGAASGIATDRGSCGHEEQRARGSAAAAHLTRAAVAAGVGVEGSDAEGWTTDSAAEIGLLPV